MGKSSAAMSFEKLHVIKPAHGKKISRSVHGTNIKLPWFCHIRTEGNAVTSGQAISIISPHVAAEVSTAIRATASTSLGWGLHFPALGPDLHRRNGHFCPCAQGEEEEQATKLEIIPN